MPSDNIEKYEANLEKARAAAVSAFTQTSLKEAARVAEIKGRARWSGGFTPSITESRWPKLPLHEKNIDPLAPKGVKGFSGDILKDGVLDYLKPEGGPLKVLWWIVKGGKTVLEVRKLTPVGIAIEGAFLLKDILEEAGDWYVKNEYQRQTAGLDVVYANVTAWVRPVWKEAEAALREVTVESARSGGYWGDQFRKALIFYLKSRPQDAQAMQPAMLAFARFCFDKRLAFIIEAMMRVAAGAFVARAWGMYLKERARTPADNARLGHPHYQGKVDIHARRKFFSSYGQHLEQLSIQLANRLSELTAEFEYTASWHQWYGGD